MVLGIPLAKFIPELFKSVSKPFVTILKRNVARSPFWKDSVFIPMAQYYNKQSVRMRLWTQGIRRNKQQIEKSSHMSDEAALELGAEIVANTMTLAIGLLAILMQQSISASSEKKKVDAEKRTVHDIEVAQLELHRKVVDMDLKVYEQDAKIRELTRLLYSTASTPTIKQSNVSSNKPNKSDKD